VSKTFKRDTIHTDTVEYKVLDDCVAISINLHKALKPLEFFASRSDWDKSVEKYKEDLVAAALGIKKEYVYYETKFWEKFNIKGFSYPEIWEDLGNIVVSPFNAIRRKTFDASKLVWFYGDAHLFYGLDTKNPLSTPYRVDYIGGVTNGDFDLRKAETILKANPNVWAVELIDIPYYNCFDGRSVAVEFMVRLPQDTYNQVCEYFRDTMKEEFWTCRVKDVLVYRPYWNDLVNVPFDIDILGLKEAYIGTEDM